MREHRYPRTVPDPTDHDNPTPADRPVSLAKLAAAVTGEDAMENVARLDKWTPRVTLIPSGRKKERQHAAEKRSRQEMERSRSVLPWWQVDRLPSYLWSPWQCEWTYHAMQRALERNITDEEFRTTFQFATWQVDEHSRRLNATYGRFELVISIDGPLPVVITVMYIEERAA